MSAAVINFSDSTGDYPAPASIIHSSAGKLLAFAGYLPASDNNLSESTGDYPASACIIYSSAGAIRASTVENPDGLFRSISSISREDAGESSQFSSHSSANFASSQKQRKRKNRAKKVDCRLNNTDENLMLDFIRDNFML